MAGEKKKIASEASSSSSSNNNNNKRGESVVVDAGRCKSSCGYCKSGFRSSISHGLVAYSLTVDDYRDGTLDVEKSDKYTELSSSSNSHGLFPEATSSSAPMDVLVDNCEKNRHEQIIQHLSDQIDAVLRECVERREFPCDVQLPKASVRIVAPAKRKLLGEGSQDLLYSSNISFQIVAAFRRANKNSLKLSVVSSGESNPVAEFTPKTIAEKLSSNLNLSANASGFSVKACNGHINFYSTVKEAQSDVVTQKVDAPKVSSTGSGGNEICLKKSSGHDYAAKRLEIRLKRSTFDPEEYALYRRYQIKVHNDMPDQVTESSYRRFLVDSPLVFVPSTGDGTAPPCGLGSFHQQYLINGRLVSVGVIDILPKCLSSKYLFWEPDLAFLSLGKYSALQEIGWVRENLSHCPSLQYYYLGYYIHSCKKMRYKAAYRPSELLCPRRYQWISFDIAKPLLDKKPYVVLSDFPTLHTEEPSPTMFENHMELQHEDFSQEDIAEVPLDEDEDMSELDFEDSEEESVPETSSLAPLDIENGNVSNIKIGLNGARLRYKDVRQAFGHPERNYLEAQLNRYMRAVGVDLSEQLVYSLG